MDMKLAENAKWIDDATPDCATRDVAVLTLQRRLSAVQHFLPLAAERADETTQHVHQLRVATRRAVAAIKLYKSILPKREARKVLKQLKRFRKAAGAARDYDVLIEKRGSAGGKAFLADLKRQRHEAQTPIRQAHERASRQPGFAERVGALLDETRQSTSDEGALAFGVWASRRLRPIVKKFFKLEPKDPRDLAAMHKFRIQGKRLRYVMELLVAAFPAAFRSELYPVVEKLQETLGDINDHATAMARFEQWCEAAPKRDAKKRLERMLAKERALTEQSLRAFQRWWTPEFSDQLRQRFEEICARDL